MLEFALACFLLIVTPGPGVLSVAGVGSGFGFKTGSTYLWGLCAGNIMVALTVISGLAALILSFPILRNLLLIACIAYMLYLAAKIALAGSKVGFMEASSAPGWKDGILLQAINPKAYAANSLLFTGFNFYPDQLSLELALKLVIWVGVWIPMHFGWLLVGVTLHRLALKDHQQRAINYVMAFSMLVVVALAYFGN